MKAEFYKMDFRAWNTGTVDLTLEQEAAYLRLCHAMYDNRGPVPESARFLQGIFRCGNVRAAALLRQLVEAGKIERTPEGRLTNRRVAKELSDRDALSETRRMAGEKGGTSRAEKASHSGVTGGSLGTHPPSDVRVSAEWMPSDASVSGANPLIENDASEANASTLRSREEKRRRDSPVVPKGTAADGFAEFKGAYPKRSTAFPTSEARKRWANAIKQGTDPADIIAGAKAYTAEQTRLGKIGTGYIKTATVWLNQRCWEDHLDQATAPDGEKRGADAYLAGLTDDRWRAEVGTWRSRLGYWPLKRKTPPPDEPATKVPPHILAEFGIVHPAPAAPTQTRAPGADPER